MNGAQAIIAAFEKHSIDTVFGYPGGCIMPLYDALVNTPVKHVLCRHEQGCALAADGYARAGGKVGVCIATSGPGATNLITGVANAFMDSIPMIVITGQVPSALIGTDAFQETDILGMTLGIVKHSYLVDRADDIPAIMNEAISIATSGRPGPVWIDLPKDILLADIDNAPLMMTPADQPPSPVCDTLIAKAITLIEQSKSPLIYSGGGISLGNAVTEFQRFIEQTNIPHVCTLKGIGNAGINAPYNLGMLGMHGSIAANIAIEECDLLICVGARFDDRATGKVDHFAPNAKIIHIDADAAEIGKLKSVDLAIRGEILPHLESLLSSLEMRSASIQHAIQPWQSRCHALKQTRGFGLPANTEHDSGPISGPAFVSMLSRLSPANTTISCDVGQHQMWVAQYYHFAKPSQHLSSGGLGTMGFGLPAAIGAQLSLPNHPIVTISGDGSIMMNIQELATVKRYGLPLKIIVLDNQHLGMVRQQQELFYEANYSEVDLSDNPEFTTVANAFGMKALKITRTCEMRRGIETLFAYSGAMLLHVCIEKEENVWPIVKPGASNKDMIEGFAV